MYSDTFAHHARSATPAELRILRNTVFARHGRRFVSPDLQEHFGRFAWYNPGVDDVDNRLSQYDRFLIAYMLRLEDRDWFNFLTREDMLTIVQGSLSGVRPPIGAVAWPTVEFRSDGSFWFWSATGDPPVRQSGFADNYKVDGQWRLSGDSVEVRLLQYTFTGGLEREDTSFGPVAIENPQWFVASDLRSFEFPEADEEFFRWAQLASPATLDVAYLYLTDNGIVVGDPVTVYKFPFLLGDPRVFR